MRYTHVIHRRFLSFPDLPHAIRKYDTCRPIGRRMSYCMTRLEGTRPHSCCDLVLLFSFISFSLPSHALISLSLFPLLFFLLLFVIFTHVSHTHIVFFIFQQITFIIPFPFSTFVEELINEREGATKDDGARGSQIDLLIYVNKKKTSPIPFTYIIFKSSVLFSHAFCVCFFDAFKDTWRFLAFAVFCCCWWRTCNLRCAQPRLCEAAR